MKVTLNWLKQYVDFNWSPEELAERLTMLGLEVEGVQKLAGEFEGIVVAQILTRDKVPGSDKLSVCKVNDGQGERTIICGAQNHKPGDKVPLILPNYALPLKPGDKEPFVIKERKVFGIVSQGMMCSPQELGLPDQVDGLLILPEDAKIGQAFAEFLGRASGDVVYDLEITPNRPDLNSIIGIAREISAATGNPLRIPDTVGRVASPGAASGDAAYKTQDLVAVRIEDEELCQRYVARVVRGVKIGPSPDWLRSTLEKIGVRSINNVVDVTNYVMLESGQPLHAFDYHLISKAADGKHTVVIRRAQAGEKFTTLDGIQRTLTGEMLLIADEQKGIALAGVMGGQNTEIKEQTADVLIESAYFKPTNIRRTSKALGLRTDASYRFERGADVGITDRASARCAQLILETAGGQLAEGAVDAYPKPVEPAQITLRHRKVTELLGVELKPQEIEYYLGQLGLKTVNRKPRPVGEESGPPEPATFQIPTFRVDLKRETDLIEEVARLYGVDKIPTTPPRGAIGSNAFDAIYDQIAEARRILTGLGLNEAQTQTLIDREAAELTVVDNIVDISLKQPLGLTQLIALANPLSDAMNVLRPTLLVGLVDAVKHNHARRNLDVGLFEIGRTFRRSDDKITENLSVSLIMTGSRNPTFWQGEGRDAQVDIFDLKGIVEAFSAQFGLRSLAFIRKESNSERFLVNSAVISIGGKLHLGEIGQLNPRLNGLLQELNPHLNKLLQVKIPVFMAELNLSEILRRRNASKSFEPLPQFPAIRRDIAMLVSEAITHAKVLEVVEQAKVANLESVDLFDVFRGQHLPDGQKSMAYAFTYRHVERTLTDAEVNAAHEKLAEQLREKLATTIR
jgi:phenylalanyl-tRNA synthetase beta chain